MSLYYLSNFRTTAQLEDMRRLEAAGVCVFCPEQLGQDPRVVHRFPRWTVTPNAFPYRATRLHLLLIPDEHVTDLADLSAESQAGFLPALTWIRDTYGLAYYGMAARNGLCEFTGGTIRHVHVHVLQGEVDDPHHDPVRVKLSSRPDIDPD